MEHIDGSHTCTAICSALLASLSVPARAALGNQAGAKANSAMQPKKLAELLLYCWVRSVMPSA
eukprot:980218-Pyramimonas_sp.AAC.1